MARKARVISSAEARPDFVIHSYSKDLSGTGQAIGGVVIGRNEDMFIPKGQSVSTASGVKSWDESLFWNVYYVKGAFLNADAAYEILQGIRTLDVRMMAKCVNTIALSRFLASHPDVRVRPVGGHGRRGAFLGPGKPWEGNRYAAVNG